MQATDLRVSIKGAAAARAEVRERRDGAVEVAYTAPMSGVYRIALAVGAASLGTFPAQCAPPRASEALSRVRLAAAGSAFVGERFAAAVEVLDQFGGRFAGDPKCAGPALAGAPCCKAYPNMYRLNRLLPDCTRTLRQLHRHGFHVWPHSRLTELFARYLARLSTVSAARRTVTTAAGMDGGQSRSLQRARLLRRLTATLADGSGAALFATDARALVEDGLHELSFTPRIAGAARGCSARVAPVLSSWSGFPSSSAGRRADAGWRPAEQCPAAASACPVFRQGPARTAASSPYPA